MAIPAGKVLCGNLTKLLEAKGSLIKKALGIDDLRIEIDEEKVSFPWFVKTPDADAARAYTHLISALCEMSRNQKVLLIKIWVCAVGNLRSVPVMDAKTKPKRLTRTLFPHSAK